MYVLLQKMRGITIVALAVACGSLMLLYPQWRAYAQAAGYYTFLLVDEEFIDKDAGAIEELASDLGVSSDFLVNEDIADVGVRDALPIPVGSILKLKTGQAGDEGLFALKTIPASWIATGPTFNDGLANYIAAGPGLGSGNDPESLLDKIPDVTPLRTAGLGRLFGGNVCALVYKSDVSINYDPLEGNLQGANRGLIAFEVVGVSISGGSLPDLTIRVDAPRACTSTLRLFGDAPTPTSSSEPPN